MSYKPITRNGMAVLYSLAAVGTNVMLMSVLLPGTNTHGLLAICKEKIKSPQEQDSIRQAIRLG